MRIQALSLLLLVLASTSMADDPRGAARARLMDMPAYGFQPDRIVRSARSFPGTPERRSNRAPAACDVLSTYPHLMDGQDLTSARTTARTRQSPSPVEVQGFPLSLPDTVYEIGNRMGNQYHVYTYDDAGRVIRDVLMYMSGQNDEKRRLESSFTSSGQLESQIMYDQMYPGGVSARSWFMYDNEGRQTSSRYLWFIPFPLVYEMWAHDSIVYDVTGNVIMAESDYSDFRRGTGHKKEEVQITDSTEVRTHSEHRDGRWVPTTRTSFLRESGTGTTVTMDEVWGGGRWINQSRWTNTLTPDGLTTESLGEIWMDKDWVPVWRSVRVRSEDGTASIDSSEEYVDGTWLPLTRGQRTFDKGSGTTVELRESWHNGWTPDGKYIFVRTSEESSRGVDSTWQQGLLLSTWEWVSLSSGYTVIGGWRSPDGGWRVSGWQESRRYTLSGQLFETIYAMMSGGTWTPVERYLDSYDNDRLHSKQHFTFAEGEWIQSAVTGTYEDPEYWPPDWWLRTEELTMGFGGYAELIFVYRSDVTGIVGPSTTLPTESALHQNYPNPFNPTTTIPFTVATGGQTTIAIYDVLGREVTRPVDAWKDPGEYRVEFDATGLASGMYVCMFRSGTTSQIRKLMFIR